MKRGQVDAAFIRSAQISYYHLWSFGKNSFNVSPGTVLNFGVMQVCNTIALGKDEDTNMSEHIFLLNTHFGQDTKLLLVLNQILILIFYSKLPI